VTLDNVQSIMYLREWEEDHQDVEKTELEKISILSVTLLCLKQSQADLHWF